MVMLVCERACHGDGVCEGVHPVQPNCSKCSARAAHSRRWQGRSATDPISFKLSVPRGSPGQSQAPESHGRFCRGPAEPHAHTLQSLPLHTHVPLPIVSPGAGHRPPADACLLFVLCSRPDRSSHRTPLLGVGADSNGFCGPS